jgi:hypothetical protein
MKKGLYYEVYINATRLKKKFLPILNSSFKKLGFIEDLALDEYKNNIRDCEVNYDAGNLN